MLPVFLIDDLGIPLRAQVRAVREEIKAEQQAAANNGHNLQHSSGNGAAAAASKRVGTLKRMLTQTDEHGRLLSDEEVGCCLCMQLTGGWTTSRLCGCWLLGSLHTGNGHK